MVETAKVVCVIGLVTVTSNHGNLQQSRYIYTSCQIFTKIKEINPTITSVSDSANLWEVLSVRRWLSWCWWWLPWWCDYCWVACLRENMSFKMAFVVVWVHIAALKPLLASTQTLTPWRKLTLHFQNSKITTYYDAAE